jgi:predicted flavoprotein YhiN
MLIKNYRVEILGSLGFDGAQVTKGGIAVSEFDNKTLQSKLIKNLYATGEVLDVDGDCGGYNLTWAFSSAFAVADAIK